MRRRLRGKCGGLSRNRQRFAGSGWGEGVSGLGWRRHCKIGFAFVPYSKPSQELLDFVKNEMDPAPQEGTGVGLAPIGHVVTVVGVEEVPVNLSIQVTCQDGWSWEDVRSQVEAVLDDYFLELRKAWADQEN